MPAHKQDAKKRLYSYTGDISDPDSCWVFIGRKNEDGYGQMWYEGRNEGAHRVSYMIHVGPIPDKKIICHSCDNPPCVNPAHLWLGTHLKNNHDMIQKGRDVRIKGEPLSKIMKKCAARGETHSSVTRPDRVARGEGSGVHKLKNHQVIEIRSLHKAGLRNKALRIKFGVSSGTIYNITSNKWWRHLL